MIIIILLVFFFVYWVAGAFSEPVGSPPEGGLSAPLTTSADNQVKEGDLRLEKLKVNQVIELGGVSRGDWPADGEPGCAWQGMRCDCRADYSDVGNVILISGVTCINGVVTDWRILDLAISSKDEVCPERPPAGCAAGLYRYGGDDLKETGFIETLNAGIGVVVNAVVGAVNGTVERVKKVWDRWF